MHHRLAILAAVTGWLALSGAGAAAAGVHQGGPGVAGGAGVGAATAAPAAASKRVGLAGYYARLPAADPRIRMSGRITVPNAHCGSATRDMQLQAGASFLRAGQHENAVVLVLIHCQSGKQTAGAQLVAGFHARMPGRPIVAGEKIRFRVSIGSGTAKAAIIFPNGDTRWVSAPGGTARGVVYAVTLPAAHPPHYSPVTFSRCYLLGRKLSSYNPKAWESVTRSGTVDGRVSGLSHGVRFTVSY